MIATPRVDIRHGSSALAESREIIYLSLYLRLLCLSHHYISMVVLCVSVDGVSSTSFFRRSTAAATAPKALQNESTIGVDYLCVCVRPE